jgi:hypothetical protein
MTPWNGVNEFDCNVAVAGVHRYCPLITQGSSTTFQDLRLPEMLVIIDRMADGSFAFEAAH